MVKNKRKSAWTATAAILLGFALILGGCSGSGDGSPSASSPSSPSGSESASGQEKPVELTLAFIGIGTMTDVQAVQEEISKITKQKINATVKLMPIDVSAWQQQTNLLLAGNEPLDLLVTSSLFNYSSQVAKGQLLPLDELLEKYGPGIKDTLEPIVFEGTRINGKIYGVSSFREVAADYGFIARKDLLDKYGIDLSQVKTYEDLGPVFQKIKENEPGIYPLVQRSNTNGIAGELVASQFDSLGEGLGVLELGEGSTKVVNLFETQKYKDAVELARKWYQAGYLMPDAATTQETNTALIKAGKAFGYLSNMKPGFEEQENQLNGYEMEAVRLTKPVGGATGPSAFMLSIPKNSKNPERAMQLMNLLYTDADVINLLDNGIEGKHYVKTEKGQIKVPDGTKSGYTFNQWEVGNAALTYTWEGTDPDHWNQLKQFNKEATYSPALGFSFDATPVKTEVAAVTNVVNQYRSGLDSGSLDPKVLTDFVSKLKQAGGDKIIAEKQKQLDAFLAVNGK
ncbi:ABC transporter substrate-binding protein [Cohnella xylanilytica]|uniref:ABC transporter substrate-binding protein n=1 Tax=Cohnella xylanilytica TaxID=557555 RepID=A0A841U647_9BACL|nr:ABC transporter substrate-binding protein [Cohnella xylanilytica]MBB6693480.1 ABC transporter substrate-binding protein [Cohnella xylanilytica]GIO16612.1 ABC transporter substrate-binding protein [Cohnella xylanilytica]